MNNILSLPLQSLPEATGSQLHWKLIMSTRNAAVLRYLSRLVVFSVRCQRGGSADEAVHWEKKQNETKNNTPQRIYAAGVLFFFLFLAQSCILMTQPEQDGFTGFAEMGKADISLSP